MSQETVDSTEPVLFPTVETNTDSVEVTATIDSSNDTVEVELGANEEAPKPVEVKPEPKPAAPTGKPCDINAKGSFETGIANMVVTKKCHIELERTQIMMLEMDGNRYVFHRTDIVPLPKEDKTS